MENAVAAAAIVSYCINTAHGTIVEEGSCEGRGGVWSSGLSNARSRGTVRWKHRPLRSQKSVCSELNSKDQLGELHRSSWICAQKVPRIIHASLQKHPFLQFQVQLRRQTGERAPVPRVPSQSENLRPPPPPPIRGDGDNDVSLQLPNGSRLVGIPGKEETVRGFPSVSLLLIDEAARVSDDLYNSVTPMLAIGDGDLWLMSTPHGKIGFFYEAWASGSGWTRISVAATDCPRIPRAFLDDERRRMGDRWFRH